MAVPNPTDGSERKCQGRKKLTRVIMGSPRRHMKIVMKRVNFFLCGPRVSGQLSTRPVMSDSTPQNWLSIPRVSSITKKRGGGVFRTQIT